MEYEHDNHPVHLIVHHIILCPKRRRKMEVGPYPEAIAANHSGRSSRESLDGDCMSHSARFCSFVSAKQPPNVSYDLDQKHILSDSRQWKQ